MNGRVKWMMSGVLLCATAWMGSASAQEQGGQTLGDRVDRAVETIQEGTQDLVGRTREGIQRVRGMVERMGVEARVMARTRWDKALQGADISVDVNREGVAVLTGTVPTDDGLAKAQQLAGDTVGVSRVVNQLSVQPAVPER